MKIILGVFLLALGYACEKSKNTEAETIIMDKDNAVNKEENNTEDGAIYYHSLNAAIHAGQYDGIIPVGELKKEGDFGLGSFEKLAYEYVMLDGKAYGIPDDGKAYNMPDSALIAYGVVKKFTPEKSIEVNEKMPRAEFESFLDSVLNRNSFVALRVTGQVSYVKYRSFHPQEKPYKPSKEVENVIFEKNNIEVDMVGFYTPEKAKMLNSPVYHFHFVDKEHTTGGHVLDFTIDQAEIQIDHAKELKVKLPPLDAVDHINLNTPPRK